MLAKKKVIICDLDNTLWNGIIGDGAVSHWTERQTTLLKLRKKGFLLAICSKNDPKNVHWRGATLSEDDFVCQQINWDSKSANIRRISQILNLKTKDFIFIDDRPDERALVTAAMPEITTLDAEAPATWSQLSLLAILLSENPDGDRTAGLQAARGTRALFERALSSRTKMHMLMTAKHWANFSFSSRSDAPSVRSLYASPNLLIAPISSICAAPARACRKLRDGMTATATRSGF